VVECVPVGSKPAVCLLQGVRVHRSSVEQRQGGHGSASGCSQSVLCRVVPRIAVINQDSLTILFVLQDKAPAHCRAGLCGGELQRRLHERDAPLICSSWVLDEEGPAKEASLEVTLVAWSACTRIKHASVRLHFSCGKD
jgi:hypothetical protein